METRACKDYGEAIREALWWLTTHGAATLDEPFEARMGGFGMHTQDGSSGYRLEFDSQNHAHINVWSGKIKGPHYTFPGNESDVRAKWRQLFLWDPKLKRRSSQQTAT